MPRENKQPEGITEEQSPREALLTYGTPFLGTLLITVGIAGGVLGGYAAVQTHLDLCGHATIVVYSPGDTKEKMVATQHGTFQRFSAKELAPADVGHSSTPFTNREIPVTFVVDSSIEARSGKGYSSLPEGKPTT